MKPEKIFRYIVLWGAFLLPFIPLIVARDMFFPFITGKNFVFRILIEIMFGSWLILAWRNAAYRPRFSWVLAALAAFIGIVVLAGIVSENPERSFWSNYERMEGLVTHLHLFAYFLAATSVLKTRKLWERFFQTSLAASVIIAFYSFLQLAGKAVINQGGVRIDATFGNSTYLAVYLLFHIFIAAFFLARSRQWSVSWWVYAGFILTHTFFLVNTATRGAVLGLIGGALLTTLLIALFGREHRKVRYSALGALVAIVITIGGFMAVRDSAFIKESPIFSRFANISLEAGATRFQVWNMAWQGVKERPILGWGQDNFIILFNKHYDSRMYGQEPWFDRAHNIVFDWLVSAGFLGFTLYLGVFAAALYHLWWYRREDEAFSVAQKSILTGLFAAYFFQNIFVFDNVFSYILFFSLLGLIHARSIEDADLPPLFERWWNAATRPEALRRVAAPAFIVLMLAIMYVVNMNGFLQNKMLIKALGAPSREGVPQTLEYFKKAIAYDSFGTSETREQLVQFATILAQAPQVPNDLKEDTHELAESEMLKQIEGEPDNARYHFFLATFYLAYGENDKSIAASRRAIELTPTKERFYHTLGNALLNKGNYDEAFEAFKTAHELAPDNAEAAQLFAAAALFKGEEELAEETLRSLQEDPEEPLNVPATPAFINAYVSLGNFHRVAELWEKRVEQTPNDPQYRFSLAASYVQIKEYDKAIEQVKKAIEINPELKAQGEQYIQDLELEQVLELNPNFRAQLEAARQSGESG